MRRQGNAEATINAPRSQEEIARDSKVLEHFNTKSIIDVVSFVRSVKSILRKWRSPGRPHNQRAMEGSTPVIRRDPVNLGGVEGEIHSPVSSFWHCTNAKSSRRGKEEMKLKISESGQME